MMRPTLIISMTLALLAAACGNTPETGAEIRLAKQAISQFRARKQAAATGASQVSLTAEQLAAIPGPVILVSTDAGQAVSVIAPVATNGATRTWASADGVTVSFRSGVLVATRGLGGDLMSADDTAAQPAIRAGMGSATRVWTHLNGDNRLVKTEVTCTYAADRDTLSIMGKSVATRRVTETCGTITNIYWFDSNRIPVASRQWVNPALGSLQFSRIKN